VNPLRRHICLFNGGPCTQANCIEHRGLKAYSLNFLGCIGRMVEQKRPPVTPTPPKWLKAILEGET